MVIEFKVCARKVLMVTQCSCFDSCINSNLTRGFDDIFPKLRSAVGQYLRCDSLGLVVSSPNFSSVFNGFFQVLGLMSSSRLKIWALTLLGSRKGMASLRPRR